MSLLRKVENTIEKYNMLSIGDHVLVSLSGGPDSTCLLHILNQFKGKYKLKISALYIDHGLRPEDVPKEIEFCREICEHLKVDFFVESIDVKGFSSREKIGIQEAARILRYEVLDSLSLRIRANKISLGHNADDQAETVIMRLLRGSGPQGLSGIPPVRKKIIRPLIEVTREEIEEYLRENQLTSVQDPSNTSERYLRNIIRKRLIPVIKEISPEAPRIIARTAEILREENDFINVQVTKALMRLMSRKSESRVELFCNPMEILNIVLLRRALRAAIDTVRDLKGLEFEHIDEIIKLIKRGKPGDRIYLPKGIRAIKGYSTLIITAEPPVKLSTYVLDRPGTVFLKEISTYLTVSEVPREELTDFGNQREVIYVDSDKVKFPITVRARKAGDYFYPFGFGKRKKLQDFFVDQKVPRDERDSIPIVESDGKIVCVVGMRLDDRFKIEHNTIKCLMIKATPKL